ncbi:C10 family peptidase [Prevotella sp. MA2016]|uniref:C10 family peptidase n=1 Tax=Prevotella sp. MA2016 TaxID=1408310 RepID=UPI00048FABFA|nr:C10 family peptidase [Prevotella sp. MA2016]
MKQLGTLLMLLFSLTVSAQSDFDIAQEFMSKKGVSLSKENKASTRGENKPYSIFNAEDGKGFAIVSNGIVIGYSTENTCDEYPFPSAASTRGFQLTPKTPIEYMVKCEWGQGEPYNWQTPLFLDEQTGAYRHALTGCSPTALAQVMYYYKMEKCKAINEFVYNGVKKLDALPETSFEWNAILPKYISGEYTEEQGQAVAKLMKYCGYSIRAGYGLHSTAAFVDLYLIKKCFDISDESYQSYTEVGNSLVFTQFSDKELEAFMDNALEKGRPLILISNNKEGNSLHTHIVDGRDDTGRYHVNCGWDGSSNGYYIMSQELLMAGEMINDVLNRLNSPFFTVIIMPDGWTDINPIEEEGAKHQVYNLQGRKVGNSLEGLPKGVYIQNKKKQVVK